MIWNSLITVKRGKKQPHVVWAGLAIAYKSVPHSYVKFALTFFYIHEKVSDIIIRILGMPSHVRHIYTMGWQALDFGIMMHCLSVLCTEQLARRTTGTASGEETSAGVPPPSRALMDYISH